MTSNAALTSLTCLGVGGDIDREITREEDGGGKKEKTTTEMIFYND